jgi:hypothetical protein
MERANFFDELRKAKDFIFAMVRCGSGTLFWEGGGTKDGYGFE